MLVVSDTHGDNTNFRVVLDREGQPDFFVHCGDIEGTEYYYDNVMQCGKIMVMGNNDFLSGLRPIETVIIDGLKILAVHGHRYRVDCSTEHLAVLGKSNNANVVFYGHSHKPKVEYNEDYGIWIVNPGSLTYPRQDGRRPSYVIMELDDDGTFRFTINYL